ncbi:hypothetical protein AAES_30502 [Amazona aestiva]|uniref:Uncharacterized protein n=1 Tax=Amazona aestiva TaxID=12930 RepID=A0A0Q3RQP6_AMAAE|nr:hypothetical protein AAES_30502 [Amazona aestiva]
MGGIIDPLSHHFEVKNWRHTSQFSGECQPYPVLPCGSGVYKGNPGQLIPEGPKSGQFDPPDSAMRSRVTENIFAQILMAPEKQCSPSSL